MLDRTTIAYADPREALISDEVMQALQAATETLAYLLYMKDTIGVALDDICMGHVRESYGRSRAALEFGRRANALPRAA